MTKYRIANHENKNLLLTIRAMVSNKEDNIDEYINSIVKDKYNDDEKLFMKINVLPSGGLRGAIYSEVLKIRNNKINYSLNIDNRIKTIDLIEIDTDTIVDVCKIIGVFIDNAIEATIDLKDGIIDIDIYLENSDLNIKISNNFNESIDLNHIFDKGYTTKGKGHGYGLSLVKQLIDNNPNIENSIYINRNIISQILIIKKK